MLWFWGAAAGETRWMEAVFLTDETCEPIFIRGRLWKDCFTTDVSRCECELLKVSRVPLKMKARYVPRSKEFTLALLYVRMAAARMRCNSESVAARLGPGVATNTELFCEANRAKRQGECDCRVEVNASSSKVTRHSWLSTESGSCAEGAQGKLFVVLVCFCYIVILNLPFISQFDAKERLIMHSTLSNPYRTVLRSS